jgi:hypothetical protein
MTSPTIVQRVVSMAKMLVLLCVGAGCFCAFGAESARADSWDRDAAFGLESTGINPWVARGPAGSPESSELEGSKDSLPVDSGDGPGNGESDGQSDGGDGGDDVDGACFVPTGMHAECVERDEICWSRSTEERPGQVDLGALERPPRR